MFWKKKHSGKNADYEKVIFELYYERVYKTAYYIVKDRYLAQDIVQETFLKAFQNMDTLRDGNKLGAWLGTIATRTAIDFHRKIKKRNDYLTEDVYINEEPFNKIYQSSVEEKIEYKLLKNIIKKNMSKLEPPKYREVIILKYEYDLSDSEIAEALGISLGAAKSRLHRARLKLKAVLGNQLEVREDDVL